MHSNIGRTGKHQKTLLRVNAVKCLTCRSCHIVAKQVMYLVVTNLFAIYIVIKSAVILWIV